MALAIAPFATPASAATTYFAAPTGSDAVACGANTHANPFATIQRALVCANQDGDAVSLAPSGATPYPGIGTVDHNVTISAEAGANARTVEADVSGSGPMTVQAGKSVTVEGVSITCVDGLAPDFNPCGSNIINNGTLTLQSDSVRGSTNAAAIKNFSPDGGSAHLTVLDSTISDNPDFGGGTVAAGIQSSLGPGTTTAQPASLTIANSTIADNGINGGNAVQGGGINVNSGTASIVNSTISGNRAQSGGGIASFIAGGVQLSNTVLAGNTASSGAPDCQSFGTTSGVVDGPGGHNLIGDGTGCSSLVNGTNGDQVGVPSPGLNPLADNGGPTDTIGLQTSSPAIAAADPTTCEDPPISGLDQRGEARDGTFGCDIGAYDTGGNGGIVNHTYFAAPSGSDAITCAANSHANPFATIQAALACTTDGDAVSLAPSGATPYPGIGTVSHNVTISAEAGANARTVEADVSGGPPERMTVPDGTSVTVEGVSIDCVDGLAPDFQPCGSNITNQGTLTLQSDSVRGSTNAGGIKNYSPDGGSAHLTVLDSTISDNPNFGGGTAAGGIQSAIGPGTTTAQAPTLTIANSTIADNGQNGGNAVRGGGIDVSAGTASIVNSTISGNNASGGSGGGGGIASNGFNGVQLSNTVVAGNTASNAGPDCLSFGTPSAITDGSGGHNLIGDGSGCGSGLANGTNGDQVGVASPGLNPLANNGGPTDTVGLQASSPAIGAADTTTCSDPPISGLDQRGEARGASSCDIGAFEAIPVGLTTTATASAHIGATIHDSATVSAGLNPTGTITFKAYGPNDATCAGAVAFTDSVSVSGNGVYPSANFTTTQLGTYRWTADYSGDTDNAPASSACNDANEGSTVTNAAPTLTTTASANVALGAKIHDTALLASGYSATGQITFRLYGPNDPTCSKAPVFTATRAVSGNDGYLSGPFTPTKPGTYRYTARYAGDAQNAVAASACGAPGESVTVSKVTPTLTTAASPNVALGHKVHDTARLAAGRSPTGKITFRLYGPGDSNCSKPPKFATSNTVSGNGTYPSADFTPKSVGTYRWRAAYSGDAGNRPVAGRCGGPGESVSVTRPG